MTPVRVLLVVSASSGCGKTTLIEHLLPELRARGVRAAVVKLTHHAVDPDTPGKDSHRLRAAGAVPTVLAAPGLVSLFMPPPPDGIAGLARLAAAAGDVDLVLVEGGRDEPDLPRVEVVPSGGALVTADRATLVAVVGDADAGAPRFGRDDAAGLAAHVAAWSARLA